MAKDEFWDIDIGEITDKIRRDLFPIIQNDLNLLFEKVIDEWYGEYEPNKYIRDNSLYNAYRITDDLFVEYEDPNIYKFNTSHRINDASYIYDTAFVKGYHGGARFGKQYLIPSRNGAPDYDGDDNHPWSDAHARNWKHANRFSSPQKTIEASLNEYLDSKELNEKIIETVERYI